jgi:hypothetical protein
LRNGRFATAWVDGDIGTVRPVIRRRALLVTAAATLAVASCGGSSSTGDDTGAAPSDVPAAAGTDETSTGSVAPEGADEPVSTADAGGDRSATPETVPGTSAGDPGSDQPATTAAPAPVEAPEALQFTAPLVGGGELDAVTLADKPTVFWFWAPT